MDSKKTYEQLQEAYSAENLNKITRKLILLYKSKNYGKIREIANKVSKYVPIDKEKDAKCFSRLMMLYHPDRGEHFRRELQKCYENNDLEQLSKHEHILLMADIDNITVDSIDESIDYQPEYVWDVEPSQGFGYDEPFGETEEFEEEPTYEKSFYNMIKIREYGHVDVEFPSYYLEDFEEFEMAYCGLETLDGVEYCVHVKQLDISNNKLSDITNLWDLTGIEELYASNNQLSIIDALSNLVNLKILDISGNTIDNIEPLLTLESLEYVNLIDNPIPQEQIEKLKAKGVLVMEDVSVTI